MLQMDLLLSMTNVIVYTRMSFSFLSSATSDKTISNINTAPNGILEHEELTFEISFTNTSDEVNLDNLQLEESFFDICEGNIYHLHRRK